MLPRSLHYEARRAPSAMLRAGPSAMLRAGPSANAQGKPTAARRKKSGCSGRDDRVRIVNTASAWTVRGMAIDLAVVPPLRSPTRLMAARRKKSGCSGRDDRGNWRGKGREYFGISRILDMNVRPQEGGITLRCAQGKPFGNAQGKKPPLHEERRGAWENQGQT